MTVLSLSDGATLRSGLLDQRKWAALRAAITAVTEIIGTG